MPFLLATAIILGIISSIFSSNTKNSYFSLINNFQFYHLLPMIRGFIPKRIVKLITSVSFSLFSFIFLSIPKRSEMKSIVNYFDFEQEDKYYYSMGLKSGSAFVNHLNIMAIFIMIAIIHSLFFLLYCFNKCINGDEIFTKMFKYIIKLL